MRKYQDAKIPLDTMWTDIDYMDQWRDFTLNQSAFSKNKMRANFTVLTLLLPERKKPMCTSSLIRQSLGLVLTLNVK